MKIQKLDLKVHTANGEPLECQGFVNLPYTFDGKTKVVPTVVIPEISKDLICGYDFWKAFDIRPAIGSQNDVTLPENAHNIERNSINSISVAANKTFYMTTDRNEPTVDSGPTIDESLDIPSIEEPDLSEITPESISTEHNLTPAEKIRLVEVIQNFPRSYDGKIGRTSLIQHTIELLPDAKPKKMPTYKYSPKIEQEVDKEIGRLLNMDAIEECTSDFVNPLLPVRKPNGKWRLCLDARRLNQMTKRDEYPFPNMVNILERLEHSKYFSIIDLKDAYHQVTLDVKCRDYTAFRTNKGLYRYKTMPFGLLNSGATLCRLMNKVLKFDLQPRVFVYLDDVIITSQTLEEHFKLLEIVANRLRSANLTISIEKSKFCQKSVRYLGYVLSEAGISTDSSKIEKC